MTTLLFFVVMSSMQMISIVLVIVLLFLGFKVLETSWSYKISKPNLWEEALAGGKVSAKLKKIERRYRDKVRFYNFWFQVERLKNENVPGAFAELGVYKGETATMIHSMDPSRKFYLFDTFAGFSDKDLQHENKSSDAMKSVDFSDASEAEVLKSIGGNENIKTVAGYFPDTVAHLGGERFALVHLDADLYRPTLAGLTYFYPRLSPGGLIIVHDFNHNWEGVRRAVSEFAPTIAERIVELPDWQGSVMIIKNIR